MIIKWFYILLTLVIFSFQSTTGQTKYSRINIDHQMKDTFSFVKKWDYSWIVVKDENTGSFEKFDGQPIKPADTAHIFHTASCSTNVQGGYDIRYCFAEEKSDSITLIFSDGLPAYASVFYFCLNIAKREFYFKPETIYPKLITGQNISYLTTKQKLTLDKLNYQVNDTILGQVDVDFTEIISVPNQKESRKRFYFRGYFRTQITKGDNNR